MTHESLSRPRHVTAAEKYLIIQVLVARGNEYGEMKDLVASD